MGGKLSWKAKYSGRQYTEVKFRGGQNTVFCPPRNFVVGKIQQSKCRGGQNTVSLLAFHSNPRNEERTRLMFVGQFNTIVGTCSTNCDNDKTCKYMIEWMNKYTAILLKELQVIVRGKVYRLSYIMPANFW